MTKSSLRKPAAKTARNRRHKTAGKAAANAHSASKVAAEPARLHRKATSKVLANGARDTHRDTIDQFEAFGDSHVPDSMRALAETSVAQMRAQYERYKGALEEMLESWGKSFGAVGEGPAILNRKAIDIADRNINLAFDLATALAGARNVTEVMELQAAYWNKQFAALRSQADEMRALSTKVTAKTAERMQAQTTRGK